MGGYIEADLLNKLGLQKEVSQVDMKHKRTGDTVKIDGSYQHKALTEGNAVQRFWHFSKQTAITKLLKPEPTDNVVDVGCGSGVISSFLGKSVKRVIGIDGNADAIEFATKKFACDNVRFEKGLVDEDFSIDMEVDKIYCLEVIEHIYYQQGFDMLKIFHKLLKPGGKVFLTTPNYKSFWPAIEWLMDKTSKSAQLQGDQHVEFYNKRKLKKLCLDAGFTVDEIRTNCFAAPWVAPIHWGLATKLDDIETGSSYLPGSIVIAILSKS